MPLHDHFRPPLSLRRHWHSFHHAWCTYLAAHLNRHLPPGYFAESNVQFGIEIDVATFDEKLNPPSGPVGWQVPAPTLTVPVTTIVDVVEVLVFDREAGPVLAGAIELVSPANKDRPEHRGAFVSKCAAYLQQGIGLIIVDVVTSRSGDLHAELLERLQPPSSVSAASALYAVAYRLASRAGRPQLDIWQNDLELGQPLPVLPLWLRGGLCVQGDLESTYQRTCDEQRVLDGL
jgi:hypothetical protein